MAFSGEHSMPPEKRKKKNRKVQKGYFAVMLKWIPLQKKTKTLNQKDTGEIAISNSQYASYKLQLN